MVDLSRSTIGSPLTPSIAIACGMLGLFLACASASAQTGGAPASATCGTSTDPAQVVDAQLAAYNAHDVDAFAACYAPDVSIYDLTGKNPVHHGIAELKKTYAFLKTVPAAFRADIVTRIVNGPIVVDHERILGLPADKGTPEAVAVYEVRDGKILNVWFPPKK
ncbi:hypothetical protein EC912_101847 [Luteibacter rhizovicinus]|uniref:SnoaL-like domain-containing protein n=1 Tax=Luteibacter rhizovicinus TaxID=242606 RepID=A0A4R3YYU6_9GAMM|nr:nuclear transport factor 2 family protein [Luteibacter rhizovicinus]TCV97830.1 hypothetical protein EC912_101847 [Luteibacter rhizovicinus]